MAADTSTAGVDHPPAGFRFRAKFSGIPGDNEMRFSAISGLKAEVDMDDYLEGGSNMLNIKLPRRVFFSDVTLKRGLLVGSALSGWFQAAFDAFVFLPLNITIDLLDDEGKPIMSWLLMDTLPKSWSISDFDAQTSGLVIEEMVLVVRSFLIL